MSSQCDKARQARQSTRGPLWRRILVPIDFSKTSLRALEVAVPLACDHQAELFLLSVVEPAVFTAGMESVAMAVPDSVIAKEAKNNLLRIARRFIPATVPATVVVDCGRALDVIARGVEEEEIDLIVLTTHGRGGLNRFLMGSTAEQVVRHARCPVFVVRAARRSKR